MELIDKIFIYLTSKYIGKDQFGNQYYQSRFRQNYLNKKSRYVIYNGKTIASKVPSKWHAWLHHLVDVIPNEIDVKYSWEKDFVPNLTGTKYAYSPILKKVSNNYHAWHPGVQNETKYN